MLYAGDGIRVNSSHPGTIWTPMVEGHFRSGGTDPVEGRKQMEANEALGYVGEPADIGWAVVYLASDESRFMTGAEMVIDGGYTAK
jgi:NAD(P)-dependent dehydrogenase (short-subunit alcohol dehydrogenase family)